MESLIRVLQINAGSSYFGGVSSFLFNIYSKIDKQQIQFDFISPYKTTYEIKRKEIEEMGGNIFELNITGNYLQKKFRFYKKLKHFLKTNNYKIVHINSGNHFFNLIAVLAAKSANIPNIIVHSHNSDSTIKKVLLGILKKPLKLIIEKHATHLLACSKKAANHMFRKKTVKNGNVNIIYNGIKTEDFSYSQTERDLIRNQLNLNNKLVVGNVARFMTQKNHVFLIKIFEELLKLHEDSVLLLVGKGNLEEKIKKLVIRKNIQDKVIFLGQRNDVNMLYQAMDVFVLPSFHEGFPVTGVEAQCSGLPIIFSDNITKEINLTKHVYYLSLKSSAKRWANLILSLKDLKRQNNSTDIDNLGYSSQNVANKLQSFYIDCFKN